MVAASMYRALILTLVLLPVGACASAQARAPVEPVALEVPPVPPRVIDTVPLPEPTAIPLVEELPASAPPATPPRARTPATRERGEPKPEAKPEPPDPDPVVQGPPPQPVPPLRTGSNGPEAERQILDILARANQLLDGVDRGVLSEDGKANYDSAKDSIQRAREAIRGSNWVLASRMAERAENIAKRLGGREILE
jgi:hypothetical protein